MRFAILALAVGGILVWGTVAQAGSKGSGAFANAQPYQVEDNSPHAIPLKSDGTTTKTVNYVSGTLMVSYNAECLAEGPDGSYLSISILVDGVAAKPDSGNGSKFCSPTGPNSHAYLMVVRQGVVRDVAGGRHTFQVIGTGVNTTRWQVRNMILLFNRL